MLLYVWLVDSSGNLNYNNYAKAILRHTNDTMLPINSIASSPLKSSKLTFSVNWTIGEDEGGGLSGRYKIKVTESPAGSWAVWFDSIATGANYTGAQGHKYYFEAGAIDKAGNIELFTGIPECSTYIDTLVPDTDSPQPPQGVWTIDGDKEITILWDQNAENDIAGYNIYRSDTSSGIYARINPYIIKGSWYKDANLPEDTTFYYVVTALDISHNESEYSNEVSANTAGFPPLPVSEFTGIPIDNAKIQLSWVISPSYDVHKYNIYWDNGSGTINYTSPYAVVMHPETLWVSNTLTAGVYKFGIRAEDITGKEEKNTGIVVSIKTETSTAGLVKAQILTPHAGKCIWGKKVTVMAKIVYGSADEVKCVKFEYKRISGADWQTIPGIPHFTNPDSTHPYFVHWDVTALPDTGYYDIRSVATDTANNTDPNPSCVTVGIFSNFPDEEEGADSSKISEHWKKEKVYSNSSNYVYCGSGNKNTANKVIIPANALQNDTRLVYYIRSPDRYNTTYKKANEFRELTLENGQEILSNEKELELEIPYLDEDDDGIVDGTDINENSLWLAYYNTATAEWDTVDFTVDTPNHKVIGWSSCTGLFGLMGQIIGIDDNKVGQGFSLAIYPNPVTGITNIRWGGVNKGEKVSLDLYDLSGRLVKSFLINQSTNQPINSIEWDTKKVPNGIYFVRFAAGETRKTTKLIIVR